MTHGRQAITMQLLLYPRLKHSLSPCESYSCSCPSLHPLLCSLRQDTCPLGLALGLTMEQKPQIHGCLDGLLHDLPMWGSSSLWSEMCSYPLPTLAPQKLAFTLSGTRLSFPSGMTYPSIFVGRWVLPVLCNSESSFSQVREIFWSRTGTEIRASHCTEWSALDLQELLHTSDRRKEFLVELAHHRMLYPRMKSGNSPT